MNEISPRESEYVPSLRVWWISSEGMYTCRINGPSGNSIRLLSGLGSPLTSLSSGQARNICTQEEGVVHGRDSRSRSR